MTAALHILCGPACSGKTRRLLRESATAARAGSGTVLWLGPTRRALEAIRVQLVAETRGCFGASFCTFQDLAEEIIRLHDPVARPLTPAQRRLVVEGLLADLHRRGELKHFGRVVETRGFAEGAVALLAEWTRNEIRPVEFVRAAYRRGYSGNRVARTRGGLTISLKERECARLYARYQRLLQRHHLYDPEGRLWYARDLLRRGIHPPFAAVRAVFVDGFTDFTRTQHDILAAFAGWVERVWLALPDEEGNERSELFARPRATVARMQASAPVLHWPPFDHTEAAAADGMLPFAIAAPPERPSGLAHVERQLFRPLRDVYQAETADGIVCLEAPGVVGEARLVARQVKSLLLAGTPAEEILVAARELTPYADLFREVFGEYGIPTDVEGIEPLLRSPAVATLLRALRLPDDDWPFAGVTALLRNGYFCPDWLEVQHDAEVIQHAEVLLRLLGEPRSRTAYLAAVQRWAHEPPAGLEDEQAEESRRKRTHELAKRCQAFLERFFRTWDAAPLQAPLAEHVVWLRRFADDLGLSRTVAGAAKDAVAWQRFQIEVDDCLRIEQLVHGPGRSTGRSEFQRRLGALASEAGLARTPRGPGRVRILSAELARTLDVAHLFVIGLGERSFPRLVAAEPFFDEQERQSLKQAGLALPCVSDLMPDEMLLFYQLVTRARQQLVLSYPAVDEKGQPLLPSSFLHLLLQCFRPGAVRVERRNMLIERYNRDIPLSMAEYRVQVAAAAPEPAVGRAGLPADLAANLADAAAMARQRFNERKYNPYDGLFRDPGVIAEVGDLFNPQKVFSPTALEDYIACPFRFFLGHVLHLESLAEPREEIEVTRRGQAFHRALSRLHIQLREQGVHAPSEAVDDQVRARLAEAVEEYATRAPSPASKMLWQLEGQRLLKAGARYRGQWQRFLEPWLPHHVAPQPTFFEVDFGLPAANGQPAASPLVIHSDGVEVRISGRIDRVDVAELENGTGFWIIDYKTGRSANYTSPDLKNFRRLQLTLYALAVEEVLLANCDARPLGLAYWMVSETGPKVVLPARGHVLWLDETKHWREVRGQLQHWVAALVSHIRSGTFPLRPRSLLCTQTCDFAQVCRIAQSRSVGKDWDLPLPGAEEETL